MKEAEVLRRRRDDGQEPAQHHRLGDGPDPAHQRQRHRSRLVHPAACAGQRRRLGRRHQHLPRPRQRAGRDRRRPEPGFAARLLRSSAAGSWKHWSHGVGRRLRVDRRSSLLSPAYDGEAGHHGVALDRRRAREERPDRPGPEPAGGGVLGACAEQPDARQGNGRGDEEARSAGGGRSLSVGYRGDGGDGAQGRRLSAAGGDAAGMRRVRRRRPTARSSGAKKSSSRCSNRAPTT